MAETHDIPLQIGAEMKRIILEDAPDEYFALPQTLDDGRAVRALLEMHFGNAGEAETEGAIGLDGGLSYFSEVFERACANLGIQPKALYALPGQ